MRLLFATTLFLSALLLFSIQPMIAKWILPKFGGTPAVWNTCVLFFQTGLLLGYGYAHLAAHLGARRQVVLHLALLSLAAVALPIRVSPGWTPPGDANPVPWLLGLLAASVGLPFFVVSSSAPLLQKWFSGTRDRAAADPYVLYAASNAGSLIGLLGYPTLVEPALRLDEQGRLWAVGYGALAALVLGCAIVSSRTERSGPVEAAPAREPAAWQNDIGRPTLRARARWVGLACIPSSLMLGVTTYLSTDISPIPLLWVIPLAIYLLTFIIVFARRGEALHGTMVRLLPPLALVLSVVMLSRAIDALALVLALHLATLFVATMVCHGELARSRPPARHLTEFYLWVALGGVLGGCFNALLAPVVFRSLVEYPLALIAAVMVVPAVTARAASPAEPETHPGLPDLVAPLAVALVAVGSHVLVRLGPLRAALVRVGIELDVTNPVGLAAVTIPAVTCLVFVSRPRSLALGLGALFLAAAFAPGAEPHVIDRERNFFGVLRVVDDPPGRTHRLYHGLTLHGAQHVGGTAAERSLPLPYYFPTSPIGEAFTSLGTPPHVGVVGLGAGTLARYAGPTQQFDFFEIDPAVERIARDPRLFTFLRDAPAETRVILGDARLSLQRMPDARYGLLVVDAFSSDAIPIHLATREAIRLYLSKVTPHGVIAFHVTNNYVDLEPVLGELARGEGLACIARFESFQDIAPAELRLGKKSSRWVLLARDRADLGGLAERPGWRVVEGRPGARPWTDDFSNLIGAIRW